jgi:hypothetical protein
MADTLLALADLVKINDVSVRDLGATDIFNDAPVLQLLNSDMASHGTSHKYVKESGAPTVGFRAANAGRDHSASSDTVVTIDLQILDACFHIDAKLADSNPRGVDFVMGRESRRHLRAAFAAAERQFFYGTGADAGGYAGLADNAGLNGLADAMVYNAGGSGAGTFSDVFMIRSTSDHANVDLIMGQDGGLAVQPYLRQLVVASNSKKMPAYWQQIDGWIGMQIGGAKSVGRMVNINHAAAATTFLLDDDKLSNLFELFPESAPPTLIVMNKRSRRQLQQSRTATNATGTPAPWPTDWEGIPIISTASVSTYATAIA